MYIVTLTISKRLFTTMGTVTRTNDEMVSIVRAHEASEATVVHRTLPPVNYEVPDTTRSMNQLL